jgi:hypothetical protein
MQLLSSFSDKKHAAAAIFIEQEHALLYPYQAGCMQLLLSLPGRRIQPLLFLSGRKYTAAAFLAK